MADVTRFGLIVFLVSGAILLALVANRVSALIKVPAPALFLLVAAFATGIWPELGQLNSQLNQRIVTVALMVILFDGGMNIGWRRFRRAVAPVLWVGVAGTVVTAAGVAIAAHWLFGFPWHTALLIGTALAPTDPAVVFSVLGGREIAGRSGTILEGESGANDPVGIALLIAVLGTAGTGWSAVVGGVGEFALQIAVGTAVGAVGGMVLRWVIQRVELPNEALYPLRMLAGAAAIYGLAAAMHGSGFLAVFLAGIILGDARAPYKPEVQRFSSALASLGEIVAFTILGLTIPLRALLGGQETLIGLGLAALLIFVVRPLLVGLVIVPIRLAITERVFVLWAGLRGAVPILLGLLLIDAGIPAGQQAYRVIFVVVLVSVVVQGGSVPAVARLLRIPMRERPPQPYATGLRLRRAPDGLRRFTIVAGTAADGCAAGNLALSGGGWLSLVSRDGELLPLRPDTVLRAGDEVLTQGGIDSDLEQLFHRRPTGSPPTGHSPTGHRPSDRGSAGRPPPTQ